MGDFAGERGAKTRETAAEDFGTAKEAERQEEEVPSQKAPCGPWI